MNLKPKASSKYSCPHTRRPTVLLAWITTIIILFCLTGCAGPSYYTQAIRGHLGLMGDREDIIVILQREGIDPDLREDLQLALDIRAFATDELGLPDNRSYTQFVQTGKQAVSWNVVAAPEFSLQARRWCFVVSGCVPYRGYFEREKANIFAQRMRDKSFDVSVSPAIAYSTLGWFDDPLLDTMLQYSNEQLAAFIFHELAHQAVYVKGDTSFNEAYAGFVEEVAVRQWLQATDRDELLLHWRSMENAAIQFNALLRKTRDRLASEYTAGRGEAAMRINKQLIFSDMKSEYQELVSESWKGKDYFKSWFSGELNNARLALINSYQGGLCAFAELYQSAGRNFHRFQHLAAEKAAMDKDQRLAWLNEPCTTIASTRDL